MSASNKKKLRKEQKTAALTEKQLKEQQEAKKLKTYTLTFVVAMLLVVAIVIGIAVRNPILSVINQNTHAITFGEHELSTADFNYYYVEAINEYYNDTYRKYVESLGNYWYLFLGFEVGVPLDEQIKDKETGTTWAQWFVDAAITNAKRACAIYDEAIKNNHKLTEDEQKKLDHLEEDLEYIAEYNNYSNVKEYLRIYYGNGSTVDNFTNYCKIATYVKSYTNAYSDALEYTDEQVREFEKDKFLNYSQFDYSIYMAVAEAYLGEGTKDENGKVTYTDQQKADALAAAKKDAETLLGSSITDAASFDKAIKALEINKKNTNAACSTYTDEFYEDIPLDEIKEWMGDDSRKENDLTMIPIVNKNNEDDDSDDVTTGYVVVLFKDRDDCKTNMVSVRHMLSAFTYTTDSEGNKKLDLTSKQKALEEAEKWLKEWKDGKATEESFAELANKHSDDGDGKSGGLYADVFPGKTVEKFNEWSFNKDRKPGDTEIIETEYGYHVMYFVETQEETYRDYLIKGDMVNKDTADYINKLVDALHVEQVNLKGLNWDYVVFIN